VTAHRIGCIGWIHGVGRIAAVAMLAACGNGDAPRTASADTAQSLARLDTSAARRAADSAARGAGHSGEMRVTTRIDDFDGVLTIEAPDVPGIHMSRVRVDGRTVLVDSLSYGLSVHAYWRHPPVTDEADPGPDLDGPSGATALITVALGGTGCPAEHRLVEVLRHDAGVAVTEAFGGCSEAPDSVWFDARGALWIRFEEYAPLFVTNEPGYKQGAPLTWVYRGSGRLEQVTGRRPTAQ
jgi:hypothetical protein